MTNRNPMPIQAVVAVLILAAFKGDMQLIKDLIVVLRREYGLPNEAPPRQYMEGAAASISRIAAAHRSGLDLPGCGDPECTGCMPDTITDPKLDELAEPAPMSLGEMLFRAITGRAPQQQAPQQQPEPEVQVTEPWPAPQPMTREDIQATMPSDGHITAFTERFAAFIKGDERRAAVGVMQAVYSPPQPGEQVYQFGGQRIALSSRPTEPFILVSPIPGEH